MTSLRQGDKDMETTTPRSETEVRHSISHQMKLEVQSYLEQNPWFSIYDQAPSTLFRIVILIHYIPLVRNVSNISVAQNAKCIVTFVIMPALSIS